MIDKVRKGIDAIMKGNYINFIPFIQILYRLLLACLINEVIATGVWLGTDKHFMIL